MERKDQPLGDLRVLEFGGDVAVRYCGRLFARQGARVTRSLAKGADAGLAYTGAAGEAYGAWLDADKRVSADAPDRGEYDLIIAGQTPADLAAARTFAAAAPGAPVLLALTWFGETGPYAHWRGDDAIIHALTGVSYAFGKADEPPILAQGHSPQIVGGVTAFIAAMAALIAPGRRPATVDVSIFEAAMCFMETAAVASAETGLTAPRLGPNRYVPTFPANIYRTQDGWVGLTALTPPQWASLAQLVGRADLAAEPSLATSLQRLEAADFLDTILVPIFAQRTTAQWVTDGDRLRIPLTPVPRPGEMHEVEHWKMRGAFAPIPGASGVAGPDLPFRMTWGGATAPAPRGGELGPLHGIRVADFSMGWAGPLAGRLLGDLGADVLKIESKAKPDWWRGWEVVEDLDPPPTEIMPNFMCVNRNKRGLNLDLTNARELDQAKAVIAASDVVIENLGPGVMDRLGLGPADQRRLRPDIVSIFMPPFGKRGPLSGIRAYGSTVEQASGMPFANGREGWAPCLQHVAYGDPVAGLYATAAALVALHARPRLGGADIELCQVECLFQLGADALIGEQVLGAPLPRTGSRRTSASPCCAAPCLGDDAWVAVCVDDGAAWGGLCQTIGAPEWAADPALASIDGRAARADEIEARIGAWSSRHTSAQAAALLQAAGVAAAPVAPHRDLHADPHLLAAGYWPVQERRYIGRHIQPATAFHLDGRRPRIRLLPPVLGEHTEEAMAEVMAGA